LERELRKLQNEDLRNLHPSTNTIGAIELRRMRGAKYRALTGNRKCTQNFDVKN
jgi:hypothetical protein